jgi:UDP-3-O-acyl N-acetylglucosamine deacetylase
MLRATRRQHTIARPAEVRGFGLFHGADVTLRFRPARPDAGIVFRRVDLPGRPEIPARLDRVGSSQHRTLIRAGDACVETIEHVMAALAGLRVDNAVVEIDAGECPNGDGSSRAFVEALDGAGIVPQDRMRPALVVEETISVRCDDAALAIHPPGPTGGLSLSYSLDYGPDAVIPAQSFYVELSADSFRAEVAAGRTFLPEADARAQRAAGIGLRTTEADLLIFGPDGVIGNELRYPDECARHKVLDMIGDLALLGVDLHGSVVACRSGHSTNAALGRSLLAAIDPGRSGGPGPPPIAEGGFVDLSGLLTSNTGA